MTHSLSMFRAALAALKSQDWREHSQVNRQDYARSYFALAASVPLYVFCFFSLTGAQSGASAFSLPLCVIVATLMALTFPLVAYLIVQLMSRMDVFKPWVTLRNWAVLALLIFMTCVCGLAYIGMLSTHIAGFMTLLAYLSTLLIDIRLAQTTADMDWTVSIFTGCTIAVASLLVLYASLLSISGY